MMICCRIINELLAMGVGLGRKIDLRQIRTRITRRACLLLDVLGMGKQLWCLNLAV